MKKWFFAATAAAGISSWMAVADAGLRDSDAGDPNPGDAVFVTMGANPNAGGGLGAARNPRDVPNDPNQYIGCLITTTTTSDSVYCIANTANNVRLDCTSTVPSHVQAARGLGTGSYLAFAVVPGSFPTACSGIVVMNGSPFTPKH